MPEDRLLPWRGVDTASPRVAVPADLLRGGPPPHFVLFDARGWETTVAASRTVYVSRADEPALDEYLRRRIPAVLSDRRVAPDARAWFLLRMLVSEAKRALDAAPRPGALLALTPLCRVATDEVQRDPGRYLASLAQSSEGTEAAAARALYAVALAAAEGVREPEALAGLAVAGIFADAGLRGLPDGLIDREHELTADELPHLHTHPERSAELLRRADVRSTVALRAVRSHHEQWGGRGYPDGLSGAAIPTEARILAIADTFVALTSRASGRPGLRAYEALMAMSQLPGRFEPRLLRAFVRLLGRALGSGERWITSERGEEPSARVA